MTSSSNQGLPSLSFVLVKNYPRAWQEFWDPIYSISRKLGIDINSALEVFRLVYECVSKEEEGRPLSTGFLIGDPEKLEKRFSDSAGIQVPRQNISERSEMMRSIFGLIDGHTSVFIIGNDGTVEDAKLVPHASSTLQENNLASDEFRGYCEQMKGVPGYGLVALGSFKTAKLFYDGNLQDEVYFSGKKGEWSHRSIVEATEALDRITSQKAIPRNVLYKIMSTTITMSNHRKGGTIIVGDHEQVLKQSETPRLKLDKINILQLRGRQEKHLLNLSTQEFALVMSQDGAPQGSSVRLMARVPEHVKLDLTASDGGRHRSAAEITAATNSVAFVVSDDGPISVFSEGKRILRI